MEEQVVKKIRLTVLRNFKTVIVVDFNKDTIESKKVVKPKLLMPILRSIKTFA